MSEQQVELKRLIESVAGREQVTIEPAIRLNGLAPALLVKPGSSEEVAECLRICAEFNAAVVPAGLMSWLECGNPLARADVVLSLERMNRIIEYSPPDLTATVEAGLTLNDFNRVTGQERQWLPLDPPGAASASLGAIAACNSSGMLRLGFGTPRDYCIGLKLVHADGSRSKSGGKVVKNVAGYDMNKLYVGSFGTLAVITELTFKLRPLPESILTAVVTRKRARSLADLAREVIASHLQPASIALTNLRMDDIAQFDHRGDALLVRFADNEAAVNHQANWLMEACGVDYKADLLNGAEDVRLWTSVAEIHSQASCALRISARLTETIAAYESVSDEAVVAADLGTGTIRIAWNAADEAAIAMINRLRAEHEAKAGALLIEHAPAGVKRQVDSWGDAGAAAGLMKSIKAKFDPESLLNPGRFVAGI